MDFKQLHSFISVVRCRSFTEAAEELGISQPTISTHIRILEEELNSRLIVRTAKSFVHRGRRKASSFPNDWETKTDSMGINSIGK